MTALRKYERLESPGLWRVSPDAQLREVVVGLRSATLVMSDPKTELALSQWSLPALLRFNPGERPALYGPGDRISETLEVEDDEMIKALETVSAAILRRHPRPGRLRGIMLGAGSALVIAVAVFWVPEHMTAYTASMLPPPTEAALGELALDDLVRLTGSPCTDKTGVAAAAKLTRRVLPDDTSQIAFMREGLDQPLHLPGGTILLPANLLELTDGPEALAGFILAEALRAKAADPTISLLQHAGLWATLRLFATGELPSAALAGYGESLVRQDPQALTDQDLLTAFKAADLSTSPYAFAVDPTGKTTLGLIEGDPFLGGSPRPVLDDGDWLNLQTICTE